MSQRLPSSLVLRNPHSRTTAANSSGTMLTSSQRAANTRKANREAQRLADEALAAESLNRGKRSHSANLIACLTIWTGPRSAMVKAKENHSKN